MNKSFTVYNESAILNRLTKCPVTLVQTEMRVLRMFWTTISCKNDVTPSIANVTSLYVIDDQMASRSPYPVRAVIYQPINHWIHPLAIV